MRVRGGVKGRGRREGGGGTRERENACMQKSTEERESVYVCMYVVVCVLKCVHIYVCMYVLYLCT